MNPTRPLRRYSRFPVRWPVLYGYEELLAEGTVLDVTGIGWRVAGSMPVAPGMQLSLQLSVPDKAQPVRVERATVLWVRECEFAIEVIEMAPQDEAWVKEFLNQNLGLPWMSEPTISHATVPRMTDDQSMSSGQSQPSQSENMVRPFLPAQADWLDLKEELIERCMEQRGCPEEEARAACDRWFREIWQPALRIFDGMAAMKARRDLTGRDSFLDN